MSIKLGQNIQSIGAQRQLDISSQKLATVYERLSSGQRINRAADDAAGLAIADQLNASSRVYGQAIRNINDGISYLNIASGAFTSLTGIITRNIELATQSANGTYSNRQRAALENEFQALAVEHDRILDSANFNNIQILRPQEIATELRIQAGYGVEGSIGINISAERFGSTLGATENTFDGSFGSPNLVPYDEAQGAFTSGDYNNDGITDVVGAGRFGGSQGFVLVNLGNSDGSFSAPISLAFGSPTNLNSNADNAISGDIDGDSNLDLIVANIGTGENSFSVFLGNGDGTFADQISTSIIGGPIEMAIGDMNNDSFTDVITVGTTGRTRLFLGNGDGTFDAPITVVDSSAGVTDYSIVIGDFDDDDNLDFARVQGAGVISVNMGVGDGTFLTPASYLTTNLNPQSYASAAIGDLNNDGNIDIIASGIVGGSSAILGNGDGTFTGGILSTNALGGSQTTLADMDGDGILDLQSGRFISIGNGDGTFQAAITAITGDTVLDSMLGEINQDGVPDVVGISITGLFVSRFFSTISGTSEATSGNSTPLSISTVEGAREAMTELDAKLSAISNELGKIGSFQSRLDMALSTVTVSKENAITAASRIMDADIASESSDLIRLDILRQAASAVLAQANQQPQLALTLLRT